MSITRHQGGVVILLSFIAALLLTILPLPEWARPFRPPWHTLVLLYWCMALPHRVGVGTGWLLGLTVDIMTETLMGHHALGLSLVAFIALKLHRRTRVFPLWQQALGILVLLILDQVVFLLVIGATGGAPLRLENWAPPLVGMLLWPWVFIVLRDLRRRFRVS